MRRHVTPDPAGVILDEILAGRDPEAVTTVMRSASVAATEFAAALENIRKIGMQAGDEYAEGIRRLAEQVE